jgi:hypothetical protein
VLIRHFFHFRSAVDVMSNFTYSIVQAMHNFTEILYLQHCHHCWFVTSRVIIRYVYRQSARVKLALPIILMMLMQSWYRSDGSKDDQLGRKDDKVENCGNNNMLNFFVAADRAQNIIINNRDKPL